MMPSIYQRLVTRHTLSETFSFIPVENGFGIWGYKALRVGTVPEGKQSFNQQLGRLAP